MSQAEFGRDIIRKSVRQVSRLIQEGLPHRRKGTRVEILLPDAVAWWQERERREAEKNKPPEGDKFTALRLRREAAETRLQELRLHEAEQSVMRTDEFERMLSEAYGRVRAKLLNFAPRAAVLAFGAQSIAATQAKLDPLVTEIMEDLANPDDVPLPDDEHDDEGDEPAEENE